MGSRNQIISYLQSQGLYLRETQVLPSFFDPLNQINGRQIKWSKMAKQTNVAIELKELQAEGMSLASMAAVHQLQLKDQHRLLDVCAAPGMKSLYASSLQELDLHSNDLSFERIKRMERLFLKHGVKSTVSKHDASKIYDQYPPESFDRILIDAPCSGEGLALTGNDKQTTAWSTAKVKRLQQLQIRILKAAWKLLKPGGRLVYATCTLNKNENERVIHKALHIDVVVRQSALSLDNLPKLACAEAWRIEPSQNSIGFFIAVLEKPIGFQD